MVVKELTPCLWHGHQLHGGAGIQRQPLDCNQLQSGEEWSGGPPSPGSLHSGGCKVAAIHRDNMIISNSTEWYDKRFRRQLKWSLRSKLQTTASSMWNFSATKSSRNQKTGPVYNNHFVTVKVVGKWKLSLNYKKKKNKKGTTSKNQTVVTAGTRTTEETGNLLALCPDLLLWQPPEICSPHQNYVWEHFLQTTTKKIQYKVKWSLSTGLPYVIWKPIIRV